MGAPPAVGRLELGVERAEGRTRAGKDGWAGVARDAELFVKVELKGQSGSVQKVNSSTSRIKDGVAVFNAAIDLEVKDGSEELRLLVCKKKPGAANVAQVVAAAGIFVKDIMKMGAISKDFDLYKPGGDGNLGGKITLDMKFTPSAAPAATGASAPASAAKKAGGGSKLGGGGGGAPVLAVLALAAAAGLALVLGQQRGAGGDDGATAKKGGRPSLSLGGK